MKLVRHKFITLHLQFYIPVVQLLGCGTGHTASYSVALKY